MSWIIATDMKLHNIKTDFGAQWGLGAFSARINRPGRETDCLVFSGYDMWNYTSIFPYVFAAL
jgi:hypothetical protein